MQSNTLRVAVHASDENGISHFAYVRYSLSNISMTIAGGFISVSLNFQAYRYGACRASTAVDRHVCGLPPTNPPPSHRNPVRPCWGLQGEPVP